MNDRAIIQPHKDGSRLQDIVEPMFRTVPTDDGRKGVRLEAAFWDALEVQAEAVGKRRSVYAGQILSEAHLAGVNATSALRSVVVSELAAEVRRQRALLALLPMLRLLQMAPVPSFALDQQKRLLNANAEFTRYVRMVAGNPTGPVRVDTAHLSLDRPIENIFADLSGSVATLECGINIRVDSRERRSSARFILAPPLPAVALVGYVLS